MHEFIIQHIDAIASTVTILGAVYAMLKYVIGKEIDPINKDLSDIKGDIKEIRLEMQKFHTRLTWLDGYITHRDKDDLESK